MNIVLETLSKFNTLAILLPLVKNELSKAIKIGISPRIDKIQNLTRENNLNKINDI